MEFVHKSIMLEEVIESLAIKPNGIYVDGTLGGAGHSSEIAKRLGPEGRLIGIDQDGEAIAAATKRLEPYRDRVTIVRSNYAQMADVLKNLGIEKVDGIILEADGSKEEQHLITEALKDGIPVVTVMTDDTATSRISFVGLNSYQMGSAYTEQIQGMLKDKGSTSVMFLSTSSSKTQETNLVYSQVKKELESRKKTGQSVDLTEYCVDSSADFDTEEFVRDMFVSDESLPDVIVCMDEIVTECVCQALVDYNQIGRASCRERV